MSVPQMAVFRLDDTSFGPPGVGTSIIQIRGSFFF